jgi:putative addiction module component (TIGR02574 family)
MNISEQDIQRLTPDERLELIEKLWDSLDDDQVPVRAVVRAEIERRLETYPRDCAAAVPWDDARARLLHRDP